MSVRITETPIDVTAETTALSRGQRDVGALVAFSGICRGEEEGAPIAALVLEHYSGMAEEEIERHVEEAKKRWPLLGVRIAHRVGRVTPGETIVLVAASSAHRQAAFAAAEFLMDYLKTRAPFWKKVEFADGTHWVAARKTDDAAAERWKKPGREAAE